MTGNGRKLAANLFFFCSMIMFGWPGASNAATPINLSFLNGNNGFRIEGEETNSLTGKYATCGSGDINGDGKKDYILTSPGPTLSTVRKAYLKFGNNSVHPPVLSTSELALNNAVTLLAPKLGLASAFGDVNGDDIDDLLISSKSNDITGTYILFGRTSWTSSTIDLTTMPASDGIMLSGTETLKLQSKDINNDGYSDIIISDQKLPSINGRRVLVVLGRADWGASARIDVDAIIGQSVFQIRSQVFNGVYCEELADLNGDAFPDFIFNYYGNSRIALLFGRSNWLASGGTYNADDALGVNGMTIQSVNFSTEIKIWPFPDVNSDGIPELLACEDNSSTDTVYLYMIYGNASRASAFSIPITDLYSDAFAKIMIQSGTTHYIGPALCPGDITGDGMPDLIISNPWESSNGNGSGSVYVLHNPQTWTPGLTINLNSLPHTQGFKYVPPQSGEELGIVHATGDINGDGIDDLLIGAPGMRKFGGYYMIYGKQLNASISPEIWTKF